MRLHVPLIVIAASCSLSSCSNLLDTKVAVARGQVAEVSVNRHCDAFPSSTKTAANMREEKGVLIFSFVCADAEPTSPFSKRDDNLWEGDVVEVFLAPGRETPTEYFEFEVTPKGVLFDAKITNLTDRHADIVVDRSWDCAGIKWGARIDPATHTWSAALHIPAASLGPKAAATKEWRLGLYRIDHGSKPGVTEELCWSPTLTLPNSFHRPSRFGLWTISPEESPKLLGTRLRAKPSSRRQEWAVRH